MSLSYLIKRLGYIALTLLVVSIVVFGITQVLPASAAQLILGEYATPEDIASLEVQLGLDQPVPMQYLRWLGGILTGDWGQSMAFSLPVSDLVFTAFGRSMVLALAALFTVTLVAIPLGVLAAVKRGTATDVAVSAVSYLGVSAPEFVTATVLLLLFANPSFGFLPSGGYTAFAEGAWPFLQHLILPVVTLTVILTAHISRQTRSELVDVLQAEFVRTATLKGLRPHTVLFKHALRNALLPTITVIALDVGFLIGGIIVVEKVFAYPGLGRMLLFAVENRDLPLLQAGALVMAGTYGIANLIADLIHAYLDPRIQYA